MRVAGARRCAPAATLLLGAIVSWLLTGVGPADIGRFVAHELGFVLIPGTLLYAGVARRWRGLLALVTVGFALGCVLEILAFALTAAMNVRDALWAYPVIAILLGGALVVGRARARRSSAGPVEASEARPSAAGGWAWALTGIGILLLAYVAVGYFATAPLPGDVGHAAYNADLMFHLGVAAEALHHWPITDPKAAGVALPYHTFVHMQLAAMAQITGIGLPTLLLRLYLLPVLACALGALHLVGMALSGRRAVGVLAALLFLLVGQAGLDPGDPLMFFNTQFFSLYGSPPYVLGLALFLPALGLLVTGLSAGELSAGEWIVLVLLLVGCAGAKASILPVLLGGLGLVVLAEAIRVARSRDRRSVARLLRAARRPAAGALGLASVVFLISYAVMYQGESGGLTFDPPGSIRSMGPITYAHTQWGGAVGPPIFWALATVVGLLGFAGPGLAGLPAALRGRRTANRLGSGAAAPELLLGLLLSGLVAFLTFNHVGGSQNFFTYYGLAAGCVLSAVGIVASSGRLAAPGGWRPGLPLLVGLAAGWTIVLLAASLIPAALFPPPRGRGVSYAIWVGVPALVVVALGAVSVRWPRHRTVWALAGMLALSTVGLLDTPLHLAYSVGRRLQAGNPIYATDGPAARGLTPDLRAALDYIRTHTAEDAVLAVNNQFSARDRARPDYMYYSALGERRVFLEGWYDTIPSARLGSIAARVSPFPGRLALNDAVFLRADRAALGVMRRRYGVRYLLVDRAHGPDRPQLARLGRAVFRQPQAVVYAV